MKMSFLLLASCLILSGNSWAKDIKHTVFNFKLSTHKLKTNDFHYAFVSVDKDTFIKEAGPFASLRTEDAPLKSENKYILIRSVFPVKKAIGLLDPDKFNELSFIKTIEKKQKVKKLKDNTFLMQAGSPTKYQYFTKYHFDADDLSSVPDSRIGRKITDLKGSDPLLQSANSTVFRQMFGFSDFIKESSEFYGFIALDEKTTLVVFIKMMIIPFDSKLDYAIERDLIKEVKVFKEILEKY